MAVRPPDFFAAPAGRGESAGTANTVYAGVRSRESGPDGIGS